MTDPRKSGIEIILTDPESPEAIREASAGLDAFGDGVIATQSIFDKAAASLRAFGEISREIVQQRYEQLGMPYGPDGLERWMAEDPRWLDRWAEDEPHA